LREKRRLRVLLKTFGLERDEVTREYRKLHIEELNDLSCLANIVRMIK
jgi:predicted DNA-binding protein